MKCRGLENVIITEKGIGEMTVMVTIGMTEIEATEMIEIETAEMNDEEIMVGAIMEGCRIFSFFVLNFTFLFLVDCFEK